MEIRRTLLSYDEQAIFALRSLYARYGYERYKMNRFEEYDLYVRNKDFLVSDEIITFTDRSGRLLALKPDVTLSIIKNAPDASGVVQKVYYNENVYRADGAHAFREIMQSGLESIGDLTDYDVAEVVLLAAKSLALISDRFVLDLSHMGLVSAALAGSGLSPAGQEEALTCLKQKNSHDLQSLCQAEGVSGDLLLALVDCCGGPEAVLEALAPRMDTPALQAPFRQLRELWMLLSEAGFGQQVQIDFSLCNDLKYYSGVVLQGYLEGVPACVLSGGQYDALLRKMGRKSHAIGFALYTDLLERLEQKEEAYDVDTLILHDGTCGAAALARAVEAAAESGSVLVAVAAPEGKRWRRLITLKNGEAAANENNG